MEQEKIDCFKFGAYYREELRIETVEILVDVNDFSVFYVNICNAPGFESELRDRLIMRQIRNCYPDVTVEKLYYPQHLNFNIVAIDRWSFTNLSDDKQWLNVMNSFNERRHKLNLKRFQPLLSPDFDLKKLSQNE